MVSVLTTIALIVIAVLLFELIIFCHEFGHFITAKKSGVLVNEFALGMGPKIFGFKKGETQYSFRLFPIGGYCALEGEDEESENPRAFNNAKVWKRMIIIIAGAVMNILLGFIMMFAIVVQSPEYAGTTVDGFSELSFSAHSGLMKGDKITKLNDYSIWNSRDLSFAVATTDWKEVDGTTVEIFKEDCALNLCGLYGEFANDKDKKYTKSQLSEVYTILKKGCYEISRTSSKDDAMDVMEHYFAEMNNTLGIKKYKVPEIEERKTRKRYVADVEVERNGKTVFLKDVQFYTYLESKDAEKPSVAIDFYVDSIPKNFGTVLEQTGSQTVSTVRMVWSSLIGMVQGKFSLKDISGPVGITSAITQVASDGLKTSFLDAFNNILVMMMLITVNLGIVNMLPFPALDGGRFVFLIIEAVFHKPIPRKVERIVNGVGLGILLLFILLITLKDIWQLLPFGG